MYILLYKLHTQLLRDSVVKLKLWRDGGIAQPPKQLDLNTIKKQVSFKTLKEKNFRKIHMHMYVCVYNIISLCICESKKKCKES